jgi:hypothetical protein
MLWRHRLIDVVMRFLPESSAAPLDPRRNVFAALLPGKPAPFGLILAAATLCYRWRRNDRGHGPRFYLAKDEVQRSGQAMRQALKISNEELTEMTGTLTALRPLLADPEPGVATLKRFLASATAVQSMDLMNALREVGECTARVDALYDAFANLAGADWAPPPLITGDDLAAAGLKPGPVFKRVLDAVYDEQLEGRVATKEQAMEVAMRLAKEG